jgi:hypothetical protein
MADDTAVRNRKPAAVRADIEALLAAPLSDTQLRGRLEELAQANAFGGYTWLWGPDLYRRNRVLFRPFILNHFASWLTTGAWRVKEVAWKGDTGRRLDAWLAEVDANDDVALFQRLYNWKQRSGRSWSQVDFKLWRTDLLQRFQAATSGPARQTVLAKLDMSGHLDEPAALALYRLDRRAAAPFILRHLPSLWGMWGQKRQLWSQLFQTALTEDDGDFAWPLYRFQVSQSEWENDVLQLSESVSEPAQLCAELERRQPEGYDLQLGMTLYRLVERRGRDVLPYVQKHLHTVYRSWWGSGRDGYKKLVQLAAAREWWDLWSALVRTCSQPQEYNTEVAGLLKDSRHGDVEVQRRLLMLTGISREWNFGPFGLAQVQQLDEATAARMYERFPDLLRGPFKMNVSTGWHATLPKLTEAVIAAEDETLIDYLASRAVTRASHPAGWGQDQVDIAERLSRYYEGFREDEDRFSLRAVQVLSQVPAYSIWNYNQLLRTNRLARMFYARSASAYLSHPQGIRDLLEAPEIHAQALAFRVLGLDSDVARRLAVDNIDLLQATLLRPLHRDTRLLAFRALENAASDAASATRIHQRCREALDLPDKKYPKEHLVGLIGRLLHQWPELRSERERPLVYGAAG